MDLWRRSIIHHVRAPISEAPCRVVQLGLRVLVASAHLQGTVLRLELREGQVLHYPLQVDLTQYSSLPVDKLVCQLLDQAYLTAAMSDKSGHLLTLRLPDDVLLEDDDDDSSDDEPSQAVVKNMTRGMLESRALRGLRRVLDQVAPKRRRIADYDDDGDVRMKWRRLLLRFTLIIRPLRRLIARARLRIRSRHVCCVAHITDESPDDVVATGAPHAAPPCEAACETTMEPIISDETSAVAFVLELPASQRCARDLEILEQAVLSMNPGSLLDAFRALPRVAQTRLLATATLRKLDANGVVVSNGQVANDAYVVLAGTLELVAPGSTTTICAGDSLGTLSPDVWEYSVYAKEPAWLLRLSTRDGETVRARRKEDHATIRAALRKLKVFRDDQNCTDEDSEESTAISAAVTCISGLAHRRACKARSAIFSQGTLACVWHIAIPHIAQARGRRCHQRRVPDRSQHSQGSLWRAAGGTRIQTSSWRHSRNRYVSTRDYVPT